MARDRKLVLNAASFAISALSLAAPVGVYADGIPYAASEERSAVATPSAQSAARAQFSSSADTALSSGGVSSDADASPERREAARAHYERARTMLLESLAEFEAARGIARPDRLVDGEKWRAAVVARVEELDRVLDPKPRVVEAAVVTSADPTLLREEAFGGKSKVEHAKLPLRTAKLEKAPARKALPKAKAVKGAEPAKKAVIEKKEEISAREEIESAKLAAKTDAAVDPMIPVNPEPAKSEKIEEKVAAVEPAKQVATENRVDPLTEEEIKVRLKKLAADIEQRDADAATAEAGAQLNVDPTAKN